MSMAKNQRIKRRRKEKKDGKYIDVMKSNHIKNQANSIIDKGLLDHATGIGSKKKKDNRGLVKKFKNLFKKKIKN
jgi:hypothetical protein